MQIGVFSDVHGDARALAAVWDALAVRGLTAGPVLNAGDNIGYGDAPAACVRFLREHTDIMCVRGNYDRNVAQYPERQDEFRRKWGRTRPEKLAAIRRDSDILSDIDRAWLLALPREQEMTLAGTEVLLTHYAPGAKEGLGPWTSDAHLKELSRATDAQVVVCGHTHIPFVRRAGGILWVNPGTVGRSRGRATYAILTLEADAPPAAHLHQVPIP